MNTAAEPVPPGSITGMVLAGGRGSRMGGVDKGLVAWAGRPLARHVLDRLRPQVAGVAINANRHLETYAAWEVPVWPDADRNFDGPLAGLLAGLRRCPTPWLACVPCDSPLLPTDLVARLARAASAAGRLLAMAATEPADAAVAQPTFLLAHRSLGDRVAASLQRGDRRIGHWARSAGAAIAVFEDAAAFANINTPAELQALAAPGA